MKSIPGQLKHYRQLNELDNSDVAYVLGISTEDYIAMEQTATEIPLRLSIKLARFYMVDPDTFLEGSTEKRMKSQSIDKHSSKQFTDEINDPITKRKIEDLPENITNVGNETNDDFKFDFDKPRKPITAKKAMDILKKHGTEVTEEQAEKVLDFMRRLAEIAVDNVLETAKWDQRLQKEPQGFLFDKTGYSCRICRHSADNGWYDHAGLRCGVCQQAILKGIIPSNICGHDELYYSEWELDREFNLKGKILTHWIRQGIIKARTIPNADSKGKHYRLFLLKDNEKFLPPKEMLICNEYIIEEKEGKEWNVPLLWFQAQDDPAAYLADYDIVKYLNFSSAPKDQVADQKPDEPPSKDRSPKN